MPFKIRTKLVIAFLAIILPFIAIVGAIALYNVNTIRKASLKAEAISEELHTVLSLQVAIDKSLMPGNDYIITGDKKYIDEFKNASKDVEGLIIKVEDALAVLKGMDMPEVREEMELLKSVRTAWTNIKEDSQRIFEIRNPAGNKEAQRLMEDMDYKWAYPVMKMLDRHHEIDRKEHTEAIEELRRSWMMAWVIMIGGAVILISFGVFFALFYSRLFTRPIQVIHNGADVIAGGNFKTRLDVKTGDEIEQLAGAMNEMALQLDSLYSNMQAMVDERTKEVSALLNASRSIQESRTFMDAAKSLFDISKGLIGATAGYVGLMSEDGTRNDVLFLDTGGRTCTVDPSIPMPIRGLREKSYREGKVVYENNFPESQWVKLLPEGHVTIDNALFAPLLIGDKAVGQIGFANKPGGFDEDDATMALAFGDIAAVSLNNIRAGEALLRSKKEWESTFDAMSDPIFIHDKDLKVIRANMAYQQASGMPLADIVGKPYYEVFPKMEGPFRMCLKALELQEEEEEEVFLSSIEKIFKVRFYPIRDIDGKFIYSIHILEDITERKEADEKLKQRINELEQFRKVTIKRELRMEELTKKVEELERKLGIRG